MATPFSFDQENTSCQDIVCCQLCPNPVELHCNFCRIYLCSSCISLHMADKTKRHEFVEFINRKEGPVLPKCKSHDRTLCEVYCNDCHEPTCLLCVTTSHKKHDITDIKSILDTFKQRIIADLEELENTIRPKYRSDVSTGVGSSEFDDVLNAIQDQEDTICKVVREIGSQLKAEVAKDKREFEQKTKKMQSSVETTGKELDLVIQNNKGILKSNDATNILHYQSKNDKFRGGPKQMQINIPIFLTGKIRQHEMQEMFGSLQCNSNLKLEEKRETKISMTNPVVLTTIQTPYGIRPSLLGIIFYENLWRVICDESENIWISGSDNKIYQINKKGSVLRTITTSNAVIDLSLNVRKELIFCVCWPNSKVYKYDGRVERTTMDLCQWCPSGLCHSANGDLLVSMRSKDNTQSRVVRYSGGTRESTLIQNNSHGTPLFSVGVTNMLLLTENGNGDICVADYAGKAVIVVNASGELRFKYQGNISKQSEKNIFQPLYIASNANNQILISDDKNNIVHVIDGEGNFLRYIEYPCNGGLSINSDHNLVIGEQSTGKIRIIKYLQ